MNKTTIDWPGLTHTWNPVVGCKHRCPYCYARKINHRFKRIPNWEEPQMFPERLEEPRYLKKPGKIFVGSMCDLFGDWVPKVWIDQVIEECAATPRHTFMFLTKNPQRYAEFDFPENCWLGCTITDSSMTAFIPGPSGPKNKSFISIEPLLGSFENVKFFNFDLIIVGAMTGPGATPPKKEWIKSIVHPNIHYKENIRKWLN